MHFTIFTTILRFSRLTRNGRAFYTGVKLTHGHWPVGPKSPRRHPRWTRSTWSAEPVAHIGPTARTPARRRWWRGGHGEEQGEVLLDRTLTSIPPAWSTWSEEAGSVGTDAGELRPWRRRWRGGVELRRPTSILTEGSKRMRRRTSWTARPHSGRPRTSASAATMAAVLGELGARGRET
jgi:hypothetical protein